MFIETRASWNEAPEERNIPRSTCSCYAPPELKEIIGVTVYKHLAALRPVPKFLMITPNRITPLPGKLRYIPKKRPPRKAAMEKHFDDWLRNDFEDANAKPGRLNNRAHLGGIFSR